MSKNVRKACNTRLCSRIICGLRCPKQVSQAGISNCIPKNTVGCNFLLWCQKQVSQAWISDCTPQNTVLYNCLLWYQKQVSQARISNYVPQNTVGCKYFSLLEILASGTKVHIYLWTMKYVYGICHKISPRLCCALLWLYHRFKQIHASYLSAAFIMMTPSNGIIFRVTGPLCGEFTGPRWSPLTKASDAELWCFLCLNKRLSKQSWGWWFETPPHPLRRHNNVLASLTLGQLCD